ncbi:MAG: beta-propeller domain-containing protein [Anaerotruncus sp.]|nr:beta-propeller domain-containing protein [Anaerotruncus sp.]
MYAVRFNGPIAYVVTFVQTDPMYKFDLLRIRFNPIELGAYYEDGVSDYLHIINDNRCSGIGRQAAIIKMARPASPA